MDKISIIGAKEHNLKNVDLEIPKNELIVITGVFPPITGLKSVSCLLVSNILSYISFDVCLSELQRTFLIASFTVILLIIILLRLIKKLLKFNSEIHLVIAV